MPLVLYVCVELNVRSVKKCFENTRFLRVVFALVVRVVMYVLSYLGRCSLLWVSSVFFSFVCFVVTLCVRRDSMANTSIIVLVRPRKMFNEIKVYRNIIEKFRNSGYSNSNYSDAVDEAILICYCGGVFY